MGNINVVLGPISDFADQAVLTPIELAVCVALFLFGRTRDAIVWSCVVAGGVFVICVLKLWCERCGIPSHRVLYSPSGHTFGGTLVYGGLLALFCRQKWVVLTGSIFLAVLFGATRIALGVHTIAETVVGGLVGLLGVGVLYALLKRSSSPPSLRVKAVTLMIVAALGFSLHGYRLGVEGWLQRTALVLGDHLACQSGI